MKRAVVTASYLEAQADGKRYRLVPVTEEIIRCITAEKEVVKETTIRNCSKLCGKREPNGADVR